MIIHMIRHGKTQGNLEKRYVGSTDEALCKEGILELTGKNYKKASRIFRSPLLRCKQTSDIIHKMLEIKEEDFIVDDFRECHFGDFEMKNYQDLNGNKDYQNFIDQNGLIAFPNGESPVEFRNRTVNAFLSVKETLLKYEEVIFVVHGGTIMALLEKFEKTHSYYDWQCKNACGYTVEFLPEKNEMIVIEKIS